MLGVEDKVKELPIRAILKNSVELIPGYCSSVLILEDSGPAPGVQGDDVGMHEPFLESKLFLDSATSTFLFFLVIKNVLYDHLLVAAEVNRSIGFAVGARADRFE